MTESCPICRRTFGDKHALGEHLITTTKHESVTTYIRRLEFLLAEAEDNVTFWRDARRKMEAAE